MTEFIRVDTRWSQRLRSNEQPSRAELHDHLLTVHRHHAGFTESCAGSCRDAHGRNSYEWLLEVVDPCRHRQVLDLACGSGALTALCRQRFGQRVALTGVDMSTDELALARQRIPDPDVKLHHGMAQDMGFLSEGSIDVVLCHWALTLMDPIEPVLAEIRRVLRSGGIVAAIVDGEPSAASGYDELNDLVYGWVQREYPGYGRVDLGDSRVRSSAPLTALMEASFDGADVRIEPAVVSLHAPPEMLAREAAGFFYASFVLSPPARRQMLNEITALFAGQAIDGQCRFSMPINRLVVSRP